ncbi:MAG: hypothetical protein NVSMB57_01450 [Actinomycetota bacterium]
MSSADADRPSIVGDRDDEWGVRRQIVLLGKDLGALRRREILRSAELAGALAERDQAYGAIVRMLASVVEAKDPRIHSHLERSLHYAKLLVARVDPTMLEDRCVEYGFLLHDIGKICVPETILNKNGPLTEKEWEVMRKHSTTGAQIVASVGALANAAPIIESHHERWDGNGYPRGLRATEIPSGARIFAIADSFDAMTSDRPYRKALSLDCALEQVQKGSGTQFAPDLVEVFLEMDWSALSRAKDSASLLG